MDIQNDALENTSYLLELLDPNEVPFLTVPFIFVTMSAKESRKLYSRYFWDVAY